MGGPASPDCAGPRNFARNMGSYEDRIAVQQDWTDSKTELMAGRHTFREWHQSRVFGETGSSFQQSRECCSPVTHDNSDKVKNTFGLSTQQIHQAHLRTSTTPSEFYHEAESAKHWEVVELHVSGLASDTDDKQLKRFCQGLDLQVVKSAVDMDPVSNQCKGRAKIMVRYNPMKASVAGLVQRFEEQHLHVDI